MNKWDKPLLITMLGLPGSGKSYFASRLAVDLPAVWLNSDNVRAAMYEAPENIIDPKLRYDVVFGAIDHVAKKILETGTNVIYDANNHKRKDRQDHYRLAKECGARSTLVYMRVSPDVSDKRALKRAAEGHQIKMTTEKLEKHKSMIEPPASGELTIIIDGTSEYSEQLKSFQEQLISISKKWEEMNIEG